MKLEMFYQIVRKGNHQTDNGRHNLSILHRPHDSSDKTRGITE